MVHTKRVILAKEWLLKLETREIWRARRLTFGRGSGAVGGRLPDGTVDSLGCHQGQGDEERRSIAGHPLQRPSQPSSLGGMDSPPGGEVLGLQTVGPESFAQGRLDGSPGSFKNCHRPHQHTELIGGEPQPDIGSPCTTWRAHCLV